MLLLLLTHPSHAFALTARLVVAPAESRSVVAPAASRRVVAPATPRQIALGE